MGCGGSGPHTSGGLCRGGEGGSLEAPTYLFDHPHPSNAVLFVVERERGLSTNRDLEGSLLCWDPWGLLQLPCLPGGIFSCPRLINI